MLIYSMVAFDRLAFNTSPFNTEQPLSSFAEMEHHLPPEEFATVTQLYNHVIRKAKWANFGTTVEHNDGEEAHANQLQVQVLPSSLMMVWMD